MNPTVVATATSTVPDTVTETAADDRPGAGPAPRPLTDQEASELLGGQQFGVLAGLKRSGHPHLSTGTRRRSRGPAAAPRPAKSERHLLHRTDPRDFHKRWPISSKIRRSDSMR
ncbi:hypothetical protein GCM10009662_74010 [Catellatospora coxensis]